MKKTRIRAILAGAGNRGMQAYARYALTHPDEIQFVAIAEPDEEKRKAFRELHSIPDEMCFTSWEEMLAEPRMADAALICTQDRMHFAPTVGALEKGYHVLLEKPMSPDPYECITMGEYARRYDRVFLLCHVLRYTSFFSTLKKLLDEGAIGRLVSIQHNENVGFWHQAHSYVRGNWRSSTGSSPMILAKSCHDMDILLWLAGADCINISSFGSLTHFRKENAPEGAPQRCLDGCPAEEKCPYYALKTYLTDDIGWPTAVICNDMSIEARTKALREGPYGRCVYRCDNDVVDHQTVNIEYANEVTASFTMCAFTNDNSRTIKLMGTRGEIRAAMEKNEIEVTDFTSGAKKVLYLKEQPSGHGGGDSGIMKEFVHLLQMGGDRHGLTSAEISVQSHLMAFAAEKSRLEKKTVNLKGYRESLEKSNPGKI